jgi:ketol-acid reductoisomerase
MTDEFEERALYLDYLKGKTIGILGYSSSAREEIDFLLSKGVRVVVGLRPIDDLWKVAEDQGFIVKSLEETAEVADILQVW